MSATGMEMNINPIGTVRSPFRKPEDLHFACERGRLADTESSIMMNAGLEAGLKGLDGFSHAWVLYRLHKADRTEMLTHPGPPGVKGLPKVGIFASRSQYRPNHMALRLVRIAGVSGREVAVRGLDALDGSPVFDIKPYIPFFDRPDNPRVAEWYGWAKSGTAGTEPADAPAGKR